MLVLFFSVFVEEAFVILVSSSSLLVGVFVSISGIGDGV